jgi:DNA repair protein RecO (recombination protein O)
VGDSAALGTLRASQLVRLADQPAFVLHRYPWRETSLVLDVFTRDYGRVALVAKGAKRPHSELKSTLVNFQPLAVSYSGRNEVKTLSRARWLGGLAPLSGLALMTAFYFNELIIRLLAREDAHPHLFDAYVKALVSLAEQMPLEATLREFELSLLAQIGLMPSLSEAQGEPLRAEQSYAISSEGLSVCSVSDPYALTGAALIEIAQSKFETPEVLAAAKRITRTLLGFHLGDKPLKTRQLLIDLHSL